jgi:hypothetical protein
MIRLREITGQENQLQAFVDHYNTLVGLPIEMAFARRSRVFAFMDNKGKMFGGFIINVAPPFRCLAGIPQEDHDRLFALLNLDETFEVVGFWFAKENRGSLASMRMWAQSLYFFKKFPRRDLLGSTISKSLLRQYSIVPFDILHQGPVQTRTRTLEKCIFVCRGKGGFVQGLVRETWRRFAKLATSVVTPQLTKGLLAPSTRSKA